LFSKLNILKVIKAYKEILNFALASTSFSGLFLLTRWLIQLLRTFSNNNLKLVNKNWEIFIAGCISSFALDRFEAGDLRLITLIIYPRSIECMWKHFKMWYYKRFYDLKYDPENDNDYTDRNSKLRIHIAGVILIVLIVYSKCWEPYAMDNSLVKRIEAINADTASERPLFESWAFLSKY
jgi:hypothetical protein